MINYRNKYTQVLIHFLIWMALFAFPYLLNSGNEAPKLDKIIKFTWIPLVMYAVVFYINYLILIDKFLLKKKYPLFIAFNMLIFLVLIGTKYNLVLDLFQPENFRPRRNSSARNVFIYRDTLSLLLPLLFSIALKMGERWLKMESEKKEAENAHLQSELQHLRYQIQPHFFFNSLNNIYSLVDISPDKAKETIHTLGKLMRYLLYESNSEKVELGKEIEFLEKYIELMKLRTPENVKVKTDFTNISTGLKIAPLLFISLIENAFKHGVSALEPCEIEFEMKEDKGVVYFYSRNYNFSKSTDDKSGSGIGLENLRKRLELLYSGKYSFETEETEGEYVSRLKIETQ
ncbi:MAG TPA: histidine kinase [Moheibacter sp.]|nr:histidine kinase [Moheibacter sp.]